MHGLAATGLAATFFELLANCGLTMFGERVGALFFAGAAFFATFLAGAFLAGAFLATFFGAAFFTDFLAFTGAAFFLPLVPEVTFLTILETTFFMEFLPFTTLHAPAKVNPHGGKDQLWRARIGFS